MSDKERELVEYFIKIVEETPSLHEKWINPPIKITTWKHLLEQDKEIERLNNIINELEKYITETKLKEFEKEYGRRYAKTFTQAEVIICNMILDKLQELKGSDKE